MNKTITKTLLLLMTVFLILPLIAISATALEEKADIRVCGYQQTKTAEGKYSVRFVIVGNETKNVDAVGAEVYVAGKSVDRQTTTVYEALNANYGAELITAESCEALYITAMAITGVPIKEGYLSFTVKPYIVVNGNKVYGESKSIKIAPEASEGLEFESNFDGTCYVVGIGECTDTDIVFPSVSPDGDEVIGIEGFAGEEITSVYIPLSVTEIGRRAFNNCDSLADVYYEGTQAQWDEISIASGNTALTDAALHCTVEKFTVVFLDYDGTVLKKEAVEKGKGATAPTPPEREGYTFDAWDKAFDNVTENLTVNALYSRNITEPTFIVSEAKAHAGDKNVEITIAVKNNPGISSIKLIAEFGQELKLTETVYNNYNASAGDEYIATPQSGSNPAIFNWIKLNGNSYGDWTFLTLKFDISETAAIGEYEIKLSYNPNNVFDISMQNINFDIINGKITVE